MPVGKKAEASHRRGAVEVLDWESPSDQIEQGIERLDSELQKTSFNKRPSLVHVAATKTAQERLKALKEARVRALERELESVMKEFNGLCVDSSSKDLSRGIDRLNRAIETAKMQLDSTTKDVDPLAPQRAVSTAEARLETLKGNHYTAVAREGSLQ